MIGERERTLVDADPIGAELVLTALAAWPRLPNLVADYLGPREWLVESREHAANLGDVRRRALALAELASHGGDEYVAAQARAIALQIDVHEDPQRYGYIDLVERLFACHFVPPDADEVKALAAEVHSLAVQLGGRGDDPVRAWEQARLISGEAKWDVALEAYQAGRRYVRERFPIPFTEALEISRTDEPVASVHLLWLEPDRMDFEVNVAVPRSPETVTFEVAHNIYPGDYLHMAVLTQRTYGIEGRLAACIKLKNAPENVIAEGIEDVAPFRLFPNPSPEQQLAWKLEWLRRAAALMAAVERRGAGASRTDVGVGLQRVGHMTPERIELELDRIDHPLWGTYVYTYWLGRHLVEEADRRAGAVVTGARHLGWLFGGLHLPESFLAQQVLK
ncbi:MAG TPA: hypothetical protein VFB69_07085 [Candidatus Dormibacteraeota bacterium]|nr:hypothetical protein [Candidatus Dormibacteraeota bacterium]